MLGFGKAPRTSDIQIGLDVSPDKQAFTLAFDGLEVAIPVGKSLPMATRAFYLALPLEDSGKGVELTFSVQGYVTTEEGATATMVFSVNGQTTVADFPGTADKDFLQQLKFAADKPSECRLCVFLLVGGNSEAYLNVTAIDAEIQSPKKKKKK